jgi:8-oxo-dGTP pyrophosphatase MutT (NUDIX family)
MEFAQKAVIFDASNRVLLVARVTAAGSFLKWELPGGRIKRHEDLDEAFIREVWEEVGLDISVGPPVYLWSWQTDGGGEIIAAARIAYAKPGPVTNVHRVPEENLGEIQWFTMQQVNKLPMDDTYRRAINSALALRDWTKRTFDE